MMKKTEKGETLLLQVLKEMTPGETVDYVVRKMRDSLSEVAPTAEEVRRYLLKLLSSAFIVYAYLLLIEDRRTHTCHPSYNTIAAATELAKNTAMKSVNTLLETGLITVESSSYFDKHGMKWKGNNLYTILPARAAVDTFHHRQLRQLELDAECRRTMRRQEEYDHRHPRAALCATAVAEAAPNPSQQCKPLCAG